MLQDKTRITMLMTVGSYHPCPLRDEHSFHKILRGRTAPRRILRLVPTTFTALHSWHCCNRRGGAVIVGAVRVVLYRLGVSADGVVDGTKELLAVRATVESGHTRLDAAFIHQVGLELGTPDLAQGASLII